MTDPVSPPRDRLAALCSRPETEWDLAEAAVLVAAVEYPGLEPGEVFARLDHFGRRAARRLPAEGARERALALAQYLHEEEGFEGNLEEYDDPRHSFINEVLDRRTGLPILLSLVYREVGRRAGVALDGVGLPGHFVVAVRDAGMFLDPFHGGRELTVEDCARIVEEMYRGALPFSSDMLKPAAPREILSRLLRNLKGLYLGRQDATRAWRIADLLVCAQPGAADELRDRGLLAVRLERYGDGATDLGRYLQVRPDARDADTVIAALRVAKRALATMN